MRLRSFHFPLVALAALSAGCGANRDATEKELADLRAEITKLRAAEASLTGRVDTLEIDRGSFAKGAQAAAPPKGSDRPDLNVVRLAPQEGDGDADSDAPRPVIRASGSEGSIRKSDKSSGRPASKKAPNNAPPSKP